MGYTLIGTEASQFSGKARAALRWKGASFEEIPATPEVYRDLIETKIGFGVIPVLLTEDGQAIQDSADIIDFADRNVPGPSIHAGTPVQGSCADTVSGEGACHSICRSSAERV